MGLKWALPYLFFHIFVLFSFSPDFWSKISTQPFKIEISNLVFRFKITYCTVGLEMDLLLFVLPCICSFLFLSRLFVKDISTTVKDRNFNFGLRFTTTSCIVGLEMGLLLIVIPYICSFFFSPDFSSKISPQSFKIGTSNLVNRFTTTSCIVELKMGLHLIVVPYVCSFFFLSRFSVKDISTTV